MFVNPSKPSGTYMYHVFQQSVSVYFARGICMFRVILFVNIDYFPGHH
jgi:hypothetical protein